MFEDSVDINFGRGAALICLAAGVMMVVAIAAGTIHVSPSDLNIARFGVP